MSNKKNVQAHYMAKVSKMENQIKEIMFLNSALDNQLTDMKLKVSQARSDRVILLNRMVSKEPNKE